ncbi:hypothetical protein Poly51_47410 [Rubripirellula tenax]|uniref:Outer membrane efflux protein n=1 Tax=Rubripirellula tenax TaxID=2528015 RepID=A0A5C6EL44_9BACT|nr:hypothetical protein [Rubripirellula tenax]TWU48837.1 hypothetical protein Poly51_47410 [Rubripirellula tenax]
MRQLIFFVFTISMVSPAFAQRGALIEDLFRTIAEAQQKNQREPVPGPPPNFDPRQAGGASAINVRSREAAQFAENLVAFSRSIDPMVAELRDASQRNPAIRAVMPDAYRLAADTRALISRCDGLASLDPIAPAYSELDARWRQLSFGLRSMEGLSNQCTGAIRECDRLASTMCRQLNLEPQFVRHGLHDLMIIGATHMETLIDDLPLSNVSPAQAKQVEHDIRVMRGQLLKEADRIDDSTYDQVVTRFTDFVGHWSPVSEAVYAIGDPHLSRRLDRIRQCGDQTYALLWMPPPQNTKSLTASAHRLEQSLGEVLDQLTIRSMVNLDSREQAAVMERSRRMFRAAKELEEAVSAGGRRDQLAAQLTPIMQDWSYLVPVYAKVPRLNPATLTAIDQEMGVLGESLGVGGMIQFDPGSLIQIAAAIEGSSEYFLADARRYQRYLTPATFQREFVASAEEVYRHAKTLHAELSGRPDLGRLQREADHLLDGWQSLSQNVASLQQHGLSTSRAASLQRAHAEMAPSVAQITAALQGR